MAVVNVINGVSTIGNSSNVDYDLAQIKNNANVNTFKTLIDGKWKSWAKGTPDAYQGFSTLKKGYGYVFKTNGALDIDFGTTVLDLNTVQISTGLALLAFPFNSKDIAGEGYLPRIKANTIKTIDGSWKSWSVGVPDDFQGVKNVTDVGGYVVDIDKVYDNYTSKTYDGESSGIVIGKITNNANTPNVSKVTGLNSLYAVISIEDNTYITVDDSLPKKTMNLVIDGVSNTIEFPQEFLGKKFTIGATTVNVIDYGVVTDNSDTTIDNYGTITDTSYENIDYGNLVDVQYVTSTAFEFTFAENTNASSPTPPDNIINNDILELMYDKVTFNSNTTKKVMNIIVDGIKTSLNFASEYTNKPFTVIKDKVSYSGTFTESESYITL